MPEITTSPSERNSASRNSKARSKNRNDGRNHRDVHDPIPECAIPCNRYHTVREAAAILKVERRLIYRLIRRGLRASRKTGDIRIHHTWIDHFMGLDETGIMVT